MNLGSERSTWWPGIKWSRRKAQDELAIGTCTFFNQALLVMQAWRLFPKLDIVCTRVLKSKYFPNGPLLDTIFASNASPLWQRIEFRLELLKGLYGDWKWADLPMSHDQWIPRQQGMKVTSLAWRTRLRWVNQLINPEDTQWNADLIWQIIHPYDRRFATVDCRRGWLYRLALRENWGLHGYKCV